jgi:hypothetical protein
MKAMDCRNGGLEADPCPGFASYLREIGYALRKAGVDWLKIG